MSDTVLKFLQTAVCENLRAREFVARAAGGAIKVFTQDVSNLRNQIEEEARKRSGLFILCYYPLPDEIETQNAQLIAARVMVELSVYLQVKSNEAKVSALDLAEKVLGASHFYKLPHHPGLGDGAMLQAREKAPMELMPAPEGYNKVNVHLFVPNVLLYSPNDGEPQP